MVSINIISCDKYSVFWSPFYYLFFKYWKDNPYDIYHITEQNSLPGELNNVKVINTGLESSSTSWSSNVILALQKQPSDYIILFLDDFFLTTKVDTNTVNKALNILRNYNDIKCIRIYPQPKGDKTSLFDNYWEHTKGKEYRISTQAAIWDKKYLLEVLKEGETPWEFEIYGSERSNEIDGKVLVLNENYPIKYINAVIRGKMTRQAIRLCKEHNIELSSKIQKMSLLEDYYWFKASNLERKIIDFINHRIIKIK